MKRKWFKKTAYAYLPIHPMGYLICLLAIVWMWPIVNATHRNAHSGSDAFYHLFVYFTCTAFWLRWIAGRTSE